MKFIFKVIFKSIFYLSIAFIITCVVVCLLLKFLPFEFVKTGYEEVFRMIFLLGIPVAILLTISQIGFKKSVRNNIKTIVISRLLIAVGFFIGVFLYSNVTALDNMCSWAGGEIIFSNNSDNSVNIVRRYFGCGATDSTPGRWVISKERICHQPFFIFKKLIPQK